MYYNFMQNTNGNTNVTSHYLSEIKTSNQTVSFATSNSNECSGKKLDAITVLSNNKCNLVCKVSKNI